MELIGKPRIPSLSEKNAAHSHIEELVQRDLPPQFYRNSRSTGEPRYEVYPQKLLPQTWELLRDSDWSGELLANADYPMTEPAGLTVMSVLADCCAGSTRSRVTDRGAAYATLGQIMGADARSRAEIRQPPDRQLVAISLEVIDAPSLDLPRLIRFREREEGHGGHSLTELRHKYRESLEKYVNALTQTSVTESDADEIKSRFRKDMRIDLANLQTELGFAKRETLLSKEVLVTVVAAVGTVASWAFGLPVTMNDAVTVAGASATVGGLAGAGNKYLSKRREILQKHPMAYMYEAAGNMPWRGMRPGRR